MKMNNQYMYYPSYYSNYYKNSNYYDQQLPFTAFYQPYTNNLPNNTNTYVKDIENENYEHSKNEEKKNQNIKKEGLKLGPIDISNEKISLFGFSVQLDDLILIALILFLYFETDCDYSILIVLGLLLFNISFSSLNLF